jgi:hypothetical protein
MLARTRIVTVRYVCDQCRQANSPSAPNEKDARALAKATGWKVQPGTCSVRREHVCPKCFRRLLEQCHGDRAARAWLAYRGQSGETCKDLGKLWGVTLQTVINWAENGYDGRRKGRPRNGPGRRSNARRS